MKGERLLRDARVDLRYAVRLFAGATVILLAAATLAVLVPTRRAAAVDAAVVLRWS